MQKLEPGIMAFLLESFPTVRGGCRMEGVETILAQGSTLSIISVQVYIAKLQETEGLVLM